MMNNVALTKPVLYTFLRCPYAIRARMAIAVSEIEVQMIQVDLRNKPASLLACSPKGTVPVLQLTDATVIEESLEIMQWALAINDPENWMNNQTTLSAEEKELIETNDKKFKRLLDRYKYAERFPEHSRDYYRKEAETIITNLNSRLTEQAYLMNDQLTFVDIAIFPFIRQFAHVDKDWFYSSSYSHLIYWLKKILDLPLFIQVMQKPKQISC